MQYNKVTPEFLAELEKIVPGKVHTGKDINEDFYRDEMPIYGSNPPDVVVEQKISQLSRNSAMIIISQSSLAVPVPA